MLVGDDDVGLKVGLCVGACVTGDLLVGEVEVGLAVGMLVGAWVIGDLLVGDAEVGLTVGMLVGACVTGDLLVGTCVVGRSDVGLCEGASVPGYAVGAGETAATSAILRMQVTSNVRLRIVVLNVVLTQLSVASSLSSALSPSTLFCFFCRAKPAFSFALPLLMRPDRSGGSVPCYTLSPAVLSVAFGLPSGAIVLFVGKTRAEKGGETKHSNR